MQTVIIITTALPQQNCACWRFDISLLDAVDHAFTGKIYTWRHARLLLVEYDACFAMQY